MTITLQTDAEAIPLRLPHAEAPYVEASGRQCPHCAEPLRVFSREEEEGHDEVRGRGRCTSCKEIVGELVVKVSTIFGIEEDRAVLYGRPRVY